MASRDWFEKDYYAVLGVGKDADAAAIAKAYRQLARENHPDAKPGDAAAESRFKQISEAYAVLSSEEKRAEYDQVRAAAGSGFRGFGGGGFGGGSQGGINLEDLLGGLFDQAGGHAARGTSRRGGTARRGRDLEAEVTLSFDDAMAGVTTSLRVRGEAACSTCGGSGAKPGTVPKRCDRCTGTGFVSSNQGLFGFSEPCPICHGAGRIVEDPCPTCDGSGTERRMREVKARLPVGVKDGTRVRLKGKGEAGAFGAAAGDLFVDVHVAPHPLFGRRDDHLTLRVPITYTEAVLGAEITVPTLDDPVTIRVPAGSEHGRTLRVKGRGVPSNKGRAGDLLVTLDLHVPSALTKAQRKAVEALAAVEDRDARHHLDAYLRYAQESVS